MSRPLAAGFPFGREFRFGRLGSADAPPSALHRREAEEAPPRMPTARALLLMLGAVLFIAVLIRVGPGAVASLFAELSWYLPLIVVFPYALMTALDTLGWRFAFRRDPVPFRSLLAARLAGEAFNMTTPTASVGGEAVKAWFIRPYVPLTESLPSVVIAKTTITIGQALYLVGGLMMAVTVLPRTSTLLQVMQWLLGLELLGVGGFVAVQVFGGLGAGGRILQRFGLLAPTGGARQRGRRSASSPSRRCGPRRRRGRSRPRVRPCAALRASSRHPMRAPTSASWSGWSPPSAIAVPTRSVTASTGAWPSARRDCG